MLFHEKITKPDPVTPPEGVEQIEDVNDPRLFTFWQTTHRLAQARQLCGVYDDFARRLGLKDEWRRHDGDESHTLQVTRRVTIGDYTADVTQEVSWRGQATARSFSNYVGESQTAWIKRVFDPASSSLRQAFLNQVMRSASEISVGPVPEPEPEQAEPEPQPA
jgi:hypothetical protein